MSKPSVVTLRIPNELKSRLAAAAEKQGVSVNQYALYVLTGDVARFEAQEQRQQWQEKQTAYRQECLSNTIIQAGMAALEQVPSGKIPKWDQ